MQLGEEWTMDKECFGEASGAWGELENVGESLGRFRDGWGGLEKVW